MKSFVLSAVITLACFFANAQEVVGKYSATNQPPYSTYTSQICRINNDFFAEILPLNKNEDELLFFDSKMNLISKKVIPADEPNVYGKILYSRMKANNDNLVVVKILKKKNKSIYTINITKYKASTGEQIISKDFLKEVKNYGPIFFSENGDYIGLSIISDIKDDLKFGVEVFSTSDFEKICTLSHTLTKNEDIASYILTKTGNFTLFTHLEKENKFKIYFYDSKGTLQKTLTETYKIGPKEELSGLFNSAPYLSDDVEIFFFNRLHDDDVVGVDAWEVDYKNQSFKKLYSFDFTEEFIKNELFNNVYSKYNSKNPSENLIAKKEKGASGLDYILSKFYINKTDGSVTLLFTKNNVKRTSKTLMYSFEGFIMMSFSQTGKNLWNSVVDTKVYYQSNAASDFYFPSFTGISMSSFETDKSILVLLPEPLGMMDKIYTLRVFDKTTGKVIAAKSILGDSFININYSAFLNDNTFIGFKLQGANNMKKKNLELQAIKF